MSEIEIEMNRMICNKCFAPLYRGKHPYHITDCGHIFCQDCLQQVKQHQCPQCQRGTMSVPLKEPLMPKLIPYFQPLAETLEMQLKVNTFRSNQMDILMHRFIELDKKYELLKTKYWLNQRNFKALVDKYVNMKSELKKKLYQMSAKFTQQSGSVESNTLRLHSAPTMNLTPMASSVELNRKKYKTADGFLIPNTPSLNCEAPQSGFPKNVLNK